MAKPNNVLTWCADCGDVDIPADKVTIIRHPNPELSTYSFDCPECGQTECRPAPLGVQRLLLVAHGAVWIDLPAELAEPGRLGPPLTNDDLLDLLLDLGTL